VYDYGEAAERPITAATTIPETSVKPATRWIAESVGHEADHPGLSARLSRASQKGM